MKFITKYGLMPLILAVSGSFVQPNMNFDIHFQANVAKRVVLLDSNSISTTETNASVLFSSSKE